MRNRTYGGVRGRKVSLPCGKLTFLLLDLGTYIHLAIIDELAAYLFYTPAA